MRKKRLVKIIKGPQGLEELLQTLAQALERANSPEEFEAELEKLVATEEREPCTSPVCPVCMYEHGRSAEEIGKAVQECFALLTHEQLLKAVTLLYGSMSVAVKDCQDYDTNHVVRRMNAQMGSAIDFLRRHNEKFAFATDTHHCKEDVAKN